MTTKTSQEQKKQVELPKRFGLGIREVPYLQDLRAQVIAAAENYRVKSHTRESSEVTPYYRNMANILLKIVPQIDLALKAASLVDNRLIESRSKCESSFRPAKKTEKTQKPQQDPLEALFGIPKSYISDELLAAIELNQDSDSLGLTRHPDLDLDDSFDLREPEQ